VDRDLLPPPILQQQLKREDRNIPAGLKIINVLNFAFIMGTKKHWNIASKNANGLQFLGLNKLSRMQIVYKIQYKHHRENISRLLWRTTVWSETVSF